LPQIRGAGDEAVVLHCESVKKTVSKDERAWFFSFKEKRAKTVSERIFHAGENPRVFGSTNLILS
jgi:hypothetical protein